MSHITFIVYCSGDTFKFKGITSSISRLLFVNATFKVGPSSPARSAHAPGGPTCLQSGNWSLRLYRVPPLTPCTLLLATPHCPKDDAQKRLEHSKLRKYRQRTGKKTSVEMCVHRSIYINIYGIDKLCGQISKQSTYTVYHVLCLLIPYI